MNTVSVLYEFDSKIFFVHLLNIHALIEKHIFRMII